MSALGDYVHLRTKNYKKYGIAKYGDNKQSLKILSNFLLNRINDANIKEPSQDTINILKQRLKRNTLESINNDKKNINNEFQNKINKIYELLAERTSPEVLGRMIGTNRNWRYTGDYEELKKKTLSKEEIENRRNRLKRLNDKITEINKQGIVTDQEIENLAKEYESITKESIGNISSLGEIQEQIQNVAYLNWISNLVGDFGEHLIALCDDKIEETAEIELDKIEKIITGRERGDIVVSKNLVARDLSSYKKTDEYGDYYLGSSQNKVDVEMKVNYEDILANAKMYYDANQITLQSEVNLFTALIYLNNLDNFGTHWLNMHSTNEFGEGKNSIAADKIVEQELAYEALVSGNPLKKNNKNANIFIFLDRKNGDVFIKSTKDLLLNEFYRFNISPSVKGIRLKNTFDPDTYQDRITQLLIEAHQVSFHISMNITSK